MTMTIFSLSEKRTIYQILTLIMKADFILNPAEVSFLDRVFEEFNMSIDEFDHMEDVEFEELASAFSLFSEDKKKYAKHLFMEMAECDQRVDPREIAIINKLSI